MLVTAIALVPTWWSHVPGCKSDHLVLHQRFMVVGICHGVHLLFLCFWQRFRSLLFTPQFAFLDKLCIAQSPELADLKAKGILGLAAFMKHSKRLVVLWSPRYFQRLWCSYEIATFLADDRQKPLVVMPAHWACSCCWNTSDSVAPSIPCGTSAICSMQTNLMIMCRCSFLHRWGASLLHPFHFHCFRCQ